MPWGVVATAAVAAYSSYEEQQAAEDKEKNNKELSELGFQRRAWLDQQQRKWNLEDRKYVEDAVGGFRPFAPAMATNFNGTPVQSPAGTSTSGLMEFDPNKPGALTSAKPKPLMTAGG